MHCLGAASDSPNDAFWDLDAFHGDELLKLIQTAHIFYLTAELGTEEKGTHTRICQRTLKQVEVTAL